MSKKDTQGTQAYASVTAWLVPGVVAGLVLVAVISYGRSEETQAASGAPLYGKAVHEAIEGLKNPGAKPAVAAARPMLPAGLAPEDYYWCEQCKAYHKRQPAQGQPAGVVPPPVAGGDLGQALGQGTEVIPPLPAGLSAADYIWCKNCKAYHKRDADPGHPADAGHAPDVGIPAATPGAQPADAIPPLPAGLSAADYYWCPNCKAYHKREPAAVVPAAGTPAVPPPAPVTPESNPAAGSPAPGTSGL